MGMFDTKLQAWTKVLKAFVQPASGSTVVVDVESSGWMPVGLPLFVEVGGAYTVTARPTDTSVTLKNLGVTGNAAPADVVPSGALIAPGGVAPTSGGTMPSGLVVVASSANNVHYEAVSQGNGDMVLLFVAASLTGDIGATLDAPPSGTGKIKCRVVYAGNTGFHKVQLSAGVGTVGGRLIYGAGFNADMGPDKDYLSFADFEWFDSGDGHGKQWHCTAFYKNYVAQI
jgi:hypothetical protein